MCALFVVVVSGATDGLEFARRLHKEGRNEDALEAVNMALTRKDDADARVLRGFIKEALGDKEGALVDYNAAAGSKDEASAQPVAGTGAEQGDMKDSYADCGGWGFMCDHGDKKAWMAEHCPLTCHLIKTGEQPVTTTSQELPDDLKDKYSECTGWASVCEVRSHCNHWHCGGGEVVLNSTTRQYQ